MTTTLKLAYDCPQDVAVLFDEYTAMLIAGDSAFEHYLMQQHYDDELKALTQKYGLPDGRLYLAYHDDALAGCIALRKIDEQCSEVKRLYVRPQYRGKHIGSHLVAQIIADAREIGYTTIVLDTLPFLESAIRLYKQFGFYETTRYNDNPMDTAIYMRLDL